MPDSSDEEAEELLEAALAGTIPKTSPPSAPSATSPSYASIVQSKPRQLNSPVPKQEKKGKLINPVTLQDLLEHGSGPTRYVS